MLITSKDNKYYKFFKKLLLKKNRNSENLFLLEGPVVISEALNFYEPKYVAVREDLVEIYKYILRDRDYLIFSKELFKGICDSENPQGICAYYPMVHKKFDLQTGKFLYLDKLRDAGNMGTIIRTADAFSLDGVIISEDSCDLYNPKTIRATMASIFRVPIFYLNEDDLIKLDFKIIASTLEDSISIKELNFSSDMILVIGNEAHGVSKKILERADLKVKIPINTNVDSLNAGVAAGIFSYMMTNEN